MGEGGAGFGEGLGLGQVSRIWGGQAVRGLGALENLGVQGGGAALGGSVLGC